MTATRADAVVVGAGVIGTGVAYYLAKSGLQVVVVEQAGVATGSTGHGHGVISLVGNDFKPGAHAELGLASARLYAEHVEMVHEDSGIDPLYHELPGLSLALLDEEEAIFREAMGRLAGQVDMQWLDGDDCRTLEPRLSDDVRGGVYYRHAQVDGRALTLAQMHAVELMQGRIISGRVTGLAQRGTQIIGVEHTGGTIATEMVVLAMGAWLRAAQEWLGLPLPVKPHHGEVLHMRMAGEPLEHFIITARHGPILPRRDGLLMVGSIGGVTMSGGDVDALHSWDPAASIELAFDVDPHPGNREHMVAQASCVIPALAESDVIAHLAGVRPLSADRMPLIGGVPGLEGLLVAGGHGTKGIHLAPITAAAVSHLALGSRSSFDVDLVTFAPQRFS